MELNMTDDVNKALLIDYNNSRLISCSTLFQGICTVRSLGNISLVEEIVEGPIVANTAEASTFAFIAPGPQNHPGLPETQVITYVPYKLKLSQTTLNLKFEEEKIQGVFCDCFPPKK